MIEVDLQLVMITCLGSRMNERVESDARLSKYKHGSRKLHSIENALLEKILIIDHAKKRKKQICAPYQISKCVMIDRCHTCVV